MSKEDRKIAQTDRSGRGDYRNGAFVEYTSRRELDFRPYRWNGNRITVEEENRLNAAWLRDLSPRERRKYMNHE